MQRIKDLFEDDSAVSPVIGVILMVAITVILAAVIASFVLGLGDSTDDVQPNIQFSTDTNTDEYVINVDTADSSANPDNIKVQYEYTDAQSTPADQSDKVAWSDSSGTIGASDNTNWVSSGGGDLSAGDSFAINTDLNDYDNVASGDDVEATVTILFETDDTSSVYTEYTFQLADA